jgi:hypothetical protein
MGTRRLGTVFEGGSYFEGPRWHDGAWWVSDFLEHTRAPVREAVLVATEVDVPHAGRP